MRVVSVTTLKLYGAFENCTGTPLVTRVPDAVPCNVNVILAAEQMPDNNNHPAASRAIRALPMKAPDGEQHLTWRFLIFPPLSCPISPIAFIGTGGLSWEFHWTLRSKFLFRLRWS